MKKTFRTENLGCANCAAKIEAAVKKLGGVTDARVNFLTQKMTLEASDASFESIVEAARKIAAKIEPGTLLVERR